MSGHKAQRAYFLGTALFALAGLGLAWPQAAQAQTATGLRGAVSEADIDADLTTGATSSRRANPDMDAPPAPAYRPVSPGAVPDEAGGQAANQRNTSLFGGPVDADALAGQPRPAPRTPSTARSRAAARNQSTQPAGNAANAPASRPRPSERNRNPAENDMVSTGSVRQRPEGYDTDRRADEGAKRAEAIESLPRREPEEDAFAPVGLRLGTFDLYPSLEQGLTATNNADNGPGGEKAILSETTLRLRATSDWEDDRASIDAFGTFRKTVSGEEIRELQGGISGNATVDLGNDWTATGSLGYAALPESASSPVEIPPTEEKPLHQTFSGSLGIEKALGKLRLGATGTFSRDTYGDADLIGGGVLSQKDRNENVASLKLRGGYEISPALTPFAEIELGRAFYDEKRDSAGYERSGNRYGARAGLAIDTGEKLSGEISAGWVRENFDDERLAAISGPTVEAALNWSPERGTVIGLRGSTLLEGTTTPGESGSILYSTRLTGERRIRADLTAQGALGLDWRDYSGSSGHDLIFSAEGGLTWWLNRYAGITGRLRHEQLKSNLPGRDYHAESVFLGVTLQR